MRVMVLVKATKDSEGGVMPSTELLETMGKYNEELVKAGIMLAGEGLKPSSQGKRVAFDGVSRTVIDGPFAETGELVAGFWLWQVKDMEEAVAWVKRCPNPMPGPSEIEIRPVFEADDFGEAFTPELRDRRLASWRRLRGSVNRSLRSCLAQASEGHRSLTPKHGMVAEPQGGSHVHGAGPPPNSDVARCNHGGAAFRAHRLQGRAHLRHAGTGRLDGQPQALP
jgi:hypothetical protein